MRRYTFRPLRLLLRQPYSHPPPAPTPTPTPPNWLLPAPPVLAFTAQHQRRHFWSRKTEPLPHNPTPGLRLIEKLVGSLNTHEGRPPSDDALVEAFRQLVGSWRDGGAILDEHARGLARTYEYLCRSPRGVRIPADGLRAALVAVQRGGGGRVGAGVGVVGLARMLFAGLAEEGVVVTGKDVLAFIGVLCNSGNTAEAVEITRRYAETLEGGEGVWAWERVLRGFAKEGDEETLLQTWELVKELGVELTPRGYESIVRFYCVKGELEKARVWYERMYEGGLVPTLATSVEVLRLCVDQRKLEYGQEVLDTILAKGKKDMKNVNNNIAMRIISRETWDVVLQWTAVMGNGLGRTDWLLEKMAEVADKIKTRPEPNIDTANGLIRFAISRKDPDMAAHFLDYAMKKGFEYNRTTLELQIAHKLLTSDIEGARKIYEELRREELPKPYEAREAKQLLSALCKADPPSIDKIHQIYLDLNDWSVRLDVDTLTTLLTVFLTRCDFRSVIELLNRDCHTYTTFQRRRVIHEIGEYIGRSTTPIEAAWDSYQILYQLFPELSVRQRTDIMRLFFELDRSDMATMVFHHMRGTPERRPDKYTYTLAFTGIAYSRDLDALRAVHNALKLDQLIEPDTMLMNALMAAYNLCGIPDRVLRFWEEVKKSREGPDYTSIGIVLDACGNMLRGGVPRVRILWGQLKAMGVGPTGENYCAYVEALAVNGNWEEAGRVVKEMEGMEGVRPDCKILGTLYLTMTPGARREEVKDWAQVVYPEEWKEVETRLAGLLEDEGGDVTKAQAFDRLGTGQIQRLIQQNRHVVLSLEAEREREREKLEAKPVYKRI